MRNFSSVVPLHSVYHISCRAFSEDGLTHLLTVIVNRCFGYCDDNDWDRWTSSEARIIASLEDWIIDCRGKSSYNPPINPAFVYSNCNTGYTVVIIWNRSELATGPVENVNSLLYRVQPYI